MQGWGQATLAAQDGAQVIHRLVVAAKQILGGNMV